MKNKLAILGGDKVCKKPIKNSPLIDRHDIKVVKSLMKNGRFSRFVGSPIPGTYEDLYKKSNEHN